LCILLSNAEYGLCKIGHSDNVDKRRKNKIEMEIPFDFPIEILNAWETYHFTGLGKALHAQFADQRFKGEWSNFTDADVARCRALAAAWLEDHPRLPVIP
jgi:hypothetical protein